MGEVTPIPGERTRFFVASASRPDQPNLVDIAELGGIGQCSCEHFNFRLLPRITKEHPTPVLRCRHILAAREYFTDEILKLMAKREQPKRREYQLR